MLREILAERIKYLHGFGPVLQPDQCGACVILRTSPDTGRRSCRTNPQEVLDSGAIVLRLVRNLPLLVYRRGKIVDERGPRRIVLRRDCQNLTVSALGLGVLGEL